LGFSVCFGGYSFVARQRNGLRSIFSSALLEPKTVLRAKFYRSRPSRGQVKEIADKPRSGQKKVTIEKGAN